MRELRNLRFSMPALHAVLFVLMCVTAWGANSNTGSLPWPLRVLYFADFPFSAFAVGAIFMVPGLNFLYSIAAWGIFGTIWWYVIASGLEDLWKVVRKIAIRTKSPYI